MRGLEIESLKGGIGLVLFCCLPIGSAWSGGEEFGKQVSPILVFIYDTHGIRAWALGRALGAFAGTIGAKTHGHLNDSVVSTHFRALAQSSNEAFPTLRSLVAALREYQRDLSAYESSSITARVHTVRVRVSNAELR